MKIYTNEQFDNMLIKLVNQDPASFLLQISGVYELVAEEYNNEVLKALDELYGESEEEESEDEEE